MRFGYCICWCYSVVFFSVLFLFLVGLNIEYFLAPNTFSKRHKWKWFVFQFECALLTAKNVLTAWWQFTGDFKSLQIIEAASKKFFKIITNLLFIWFMSCNELNTFLYIVQCCIWNATKKKTRVNNLFNTFCFVNQSNQARSVSIVCVCVCVCMSSESTIQNWSHLQTERAKIRFENSIDNL